MLNGTELQASLAAKSDVSNSFMVSDVIGLQSVIIEEVNVVHEYTVSDVNGLHKDLSGKASTDNPIFMGNIDFNLNSSIVMEAVNPPNNAQCINWRVAANDNG